MTDQEMRIAVQLARAGYKNLSSEVNGYKCLLIEIHGDFEDNKNDDEKNKQHTSGYARVFENETTVVVSIQGTVLENGDMQHWSQQGLLQYESMRAMYENVAKATFEKGKKLMFVGHSMGGMEAQMAAREFGAEAVAVNSLGLLPSVIKELNESDKIINFGKNDTPNQVTYLNVDGEVLGELGELANEMKKTVTYGPQYTVPTDKEFLEVLSQDMDRFSKPLSLMAKCINNCMAVFLFNGKTFYY